MELFWNQSQKPIFYEFIDYCLKSDVLARTPLFSDFMADFIVDFQITKGTGRDLHFSYCYEINLFRLSRIWKKKKRKCEREYLTKICFTKFYFYVLYGMMTIFLYATTFFFEVFRELAHQMFSIFLCKVKDLIVIKTFFWGKICLTRKWIKQGQNGSCLFEIRFCTDCGKFIYISLDQR